MTTLNDFVVTDDVTDNLAEFHNRLLGGNLRAEFSNTETISGTKELSDGDCPIQIITASGANRTVELAPEASTNHLTVIMNAGASNSVLIKDDSGSTTFATLLPGGWAFCVPTGSTWKVSSQPIQPAWTPSFSGFSIVNGSVVAKHLKIGPFNAFQLAVVFGGSDTYSGTFQFNLPTTPISGFSTAMPIGIARYKDATGGSAAQGIVQLASGGSTCTLVVYDASGTYVTATSVSNTVPWTWAQNDDFECSGFYLSD